MNDKTLHDLMRVKDSVSNASVALALVHIVEALKQQPGFAKDAFCHDLVNSAKLYTDPKYRLTRMLLQLCAGMAPVPPKTPARANAKRSR